jgi:hypothetical protein
LQESIINRKKIVLRSFDLNEGSKGKIEFALRWIAERYKCNALASVMYACVKEFLFNGIKANVKRVLFDLNRINIFIEDEYDKGMKIFKENLSPEKIKGFLPLMKGHGLYTDLGIEHAHDAIILLVTNNVLMTDFEVARIQKKYASLKDFDNLGEFFEEYADETEGAGLGISMVMIMLKNLDFPGFVNIYKNETCTSVRIVFPLVADYQDQQAEFEKENRMIKLI